MCRIKNELDCRSTATNLMNIIKKCRKIFLRKEGTNYFTLKMTTCHNEAKKFVIFKGFANGLSKGSKNLFTRNFNTKVCSEKL